MNEERKIDSAVSALSQYFQNLKQFPQNFLASVARHGALDSRRARAQAVFSNVFLHVHSAKVHRFSLRWNYTFGLGIMCVGLFAILIITGLLLMIYYRPDTQHAYNSMKDLIYIVPSGRLVRNVHRWGAHLMVIAVFLHMARVFYTSSYKKGREFNWVIGLVLFIFTLALSFTGYLLPWDQLAYWATTIGANIAASPRELTDALHLTWIFDIGTLQKRLLLGADSIGNDALIRFYFLHSVFLPLLLTLFLMVHLWRIRKDGGLSRPDVIDSRLLEGLPENTMAQKTFAAKSKKTYNLVAMVRGKRISFDDDSPENLVDTIPHALTYEFVAFMFILAITIVLSYFFDAPLKEPANPILPENPAKAPWYFLGLQELVSYSAFMGGIGIPTIAIVGLALIPYIDRTEGSVGKWFENKSGLRLTLWSALFATVSCVAMLTITVNFGWFRNWFPQIPQLVIIVVNPGTILVLLFSIWSIFTIKIFDSIRFGAIALFTCFFVSFIILTYFASIHRGPNWGFYWWPSLWPIN